MRFRFEKVIRDAQDSICAAIEEIDGTKFRQVGVWWGRGGWVDGVGPGRGATHWAARSAAHDHRPARSPRLPPGIRTPLTCAPPPLIAPRARRTPQDAWVRAEGGGGITRVMQDGNVWEKVGGRGGGVWGTA
jgi:coproporphyrinogen III oxidase